MRPHDDADAHFRAYRAAFRREAQRLGMFVALYHYLHDRRHDRLAELNLAPAFFQTVLTALRSGIVTWSHILNRYSVSFDGDYFVFDPINQLDAEHVIAALREYRRR